MLYVRIFLTYRYMFEIETRRENYRLFVPMIGLASHNSIVRLAKELLLSDSMAPIGWWDSHIQCIGKMYMSPVLHWGYDTSRNSVVKSDTGLFTLTPWLRCILSRLYPHEVNNRSICSSVIPVISGSVSSSASAPSPPHWRP
jgi:hypothetical protein